MRYTCHLILNYSFGWQIVKNIPYYHSSHRTAASWWKHWSQISNWKLTIMCMVWRVPYTTHPIPTTYLIDVPVSPIFRGVSVQYQWRHSVGMTLIKMLLLNLLRNMWMQKPLQYLQSAIKWMLIKTYHIKADTEIELPGCKSITAWLERIEHIDSHESWRGPEKDASAFVI